MPPKYPLQALQKLREGEFEQRAAALAKLQTELKRREVRLEIALRARCEAEACSSSFAEETSDKLSRGATEVLELQQRGQWQAELKRRVERSQKAEALARQSFESVRLKLEEAQLELSRASAERNVVTKHRERWQLGIKEQLEDRAEEERDDWARSRVAESRAKR